MPILRMSRNIAGKGKAGTNYYDAQWDGKQILVAVSPELWEFLRASMSEPDAWDRCERLAKSRAATGQFDAPSLIYLTSNEARDGCCTDSRQRPDRATAILRNEPARRGDTGGFSILQHRARGALRRCLK
jgi:hypothetical protein